MANNHDTRQKLKALYAMIPPFECIPGCTDCCGPVPFARREWAPIKDKRRAGPDPLTCPYAGAVANPIHEQSPLLCQAKGCAIYDQRPLMCRLFGATEEPRLTCPHGCGPEEPLSIEQARAIVRDYLKLMEY